ncbi:hypothetical protein RAM_31675 [Amycolatopsis mediterranei S699]|nr:hypothetical protein RAM_31675 [Amycolatopsis mediterranei S699]
MLAAVVAGLVLMVTSTTMLAVNAAEQAAIERQQQAQAHE